MNIACPCTQNSQGNMLLFFLVSTKWELHTRPWLLPPRSCSSGNILFTSATIPPHSSLRAFCHLSSSSFVCSGSSASTADQKNVTSPLCSSAPRSLRYGGVQNDPASAKANSRSVQTNEQCSIARAAAVGSSAFRVHTAPAVWLWCTFVVRSQTGLRRLTVQKKSIEWITKSSNLVKCLLGVCFALI